MITAGIIKEINISSSTYIDNKYLVELSIFKLPGDQNSSNYTYRANCSVIPGFYYPYQVGDKVFVGFLNNEYSYPIILGKIYQGLEYQNRCKALLDSLEVSGTVKLSRSTNIGDISYEDLNNRFMDIDQLKDKVDNIVKFLHKITLKSSASNTEIQLMITNNKKNNYKNINDINKDIKNIYNNFSAPCIQKNTAGYFINNTSLFIDEDIIKVKNTLSDSIDVLDTFVSDDVVMS